MEGFSVPEATAFAIATRLHEKIRGKFLVRFRAAGAVKRSIILLKGGVESSLYDTDKDIPFEQESYFHYLFGVSESGCLGVLSVDSGEVHLFIPELDRNLGTWFPIPSLEETGDKYGFPTHFTKDLKTVLHTVNPSLVYVNNGINTDSGVSRLSSYVSPQELEGFQVNEDLLFLILTDSRVFKLPEEVEILRRAGKTASLAQVEVLHRCKPGLHEYHLAAEFLSYVSNYHQTLAFNSVCSTGNHTSILHYVTLSAPINDGDIVVSDQGSSLYGYKSDITVTFPANGHFTEKQRGVYDAVFRARNAVIATAKPGVGWTDMHKLAEREVLGKLTELGLVKGDIDAMLEARVGGIFMPHGLGHLIGLETHDVGGYLHSEPRLPVLGLKSLRTRRVLEPGMYITVEPGCYFIDFLINRGLEDPVQSQYLVAERIAEYRGFGGVRLEDDMLITESGNELLTDVPRRPEDVERVMAGENWPLAS